MTRATDCPPPTDIPAPWGRRDRLLSRSTRETGRPSPTGRFAADEAARPQRRSRRSLWRVRDPRARWTLGAAALLALTLGCASCGDTAFRFSTTAQTPLPISLARARCPAKPLLTPGNSHTLVPGHPTGALICRYSSPNPGSSDAPLQLAGAAQVGKQDVINHIVGELNALPPPSQPVQSCPDFNGRSSLIIFRYHDVSRANKNPHWWPDNSPR